MKQINPMTWTSLTAILCSVAFGNIPVLSIVAYILIVAWFAASIYVTFRYY